MDWKSADLQPKKARIKLVFFLSFVILLLGVTTKYMDLSDNLVIGFGSIIRWVCLGDNMIMIIGYNLQRSTERGNLALFKINDFDQLFVWMANQ